MRQLKAFDVERTQHKLIVRPGRTMHAGVDASTKRIAMAVVARNGTRASGLESIPTLEGAPRLVAIRSAARELAERFNAWPQQPGVCVVEAALAGGKRPNPELTYALGATLCGLQEGLPGTRIETVASSKWKLEVCGYGAIKKPKPTSGEPYAVLEWAREAGYTGSSWDEADAWAIAEYARQTYLLDPR